MIWEIDEDVIKKTKFYYRKKKDVFFPRGKTKVFKV
jgi:hypothetical protein